MIKAIEGKNGYKFASGIALRHESTLMTNAYEIVVGIYMRAGDCENAKMNYEKMKAIAAADFQAVNVYGKYVYVIEPDDDRAYYYITRQEELGYLVNGVERYKECVDPNEIKSLSYSDEELKYHDDFAVFTTGMQVRLLLKDCAGVRKYFDKTKGLPLKKEDVEWMKKYIDPNNVCISKEEFDSLAANAEK